MSQFVPGYFIMPPTEVGATLIFIPSLTKGICASELALWGGKNGYDRIGYVPARIKKEQQSNAAAQA